MGKIIRGGIEYGGIPDSGKYWEGTQAQYDAITTKDPNTIYFITDSDTGNYGINDLADVNITSAANGQLLTYDSANSVWVNKNSSNLPIAYISFSGDDAPSSWAASGTAYTNATIKDTDNNTIQPSDIVNYNVIFKYKKTTGIPQYTYECPYSEIAHNSSNVLIRADWQVSSSLGSAIYCLRWELSSPTNVICYCSEIPTISKTASSGGTALSLVTTGEKYSWDNRLPKVVYTNTNWENSHSWPAELNQVFILTTESTNDLVILRIYSNGSISFNRVSGTVITSATYSSSENRVYVTVNNKGLIATRIA